MGKSSRLLTSKSMSNSNDHTQNKKSIKFYVRNWIEKNRDKLKGKAVVDFPAGNGITSKMLLEAGAIVFPFDLFPEYFKQDNLVCQKADINEGLFLESNSIDFLICQEGIEHFADQLKAFKEFNRTLKIGGNLLITTPNYSNLQSRLSYFLNESEKFNSTMPPNEVDSIWMSQTTDKNEIYYGHIFLIGIQKLRLLASLNGFKIKECHPTRKKTTSFLLYLMYFPIIWLNSRMVFGKNCRKHQTSNPEAITTYKEQFRLSISRKTLTHSHLMIEFEKISEIQDVASNLQSMHKTFGET